MTLLEVGAGAGYVESSDGFGASARADCDLFFAVKDAQVGVLDDDRDDLSSVTRTEFDALPGDHDAPAGMDFPLRAKRSRRQRGRRKRSGRCPRTAEATNLVGADRAGPRADQRVVSDGVQQVAIQPQGDSAPGPRESHEMADSGDRDNTVLVHGTVDLDYLARLDDSRAVGATQCRPLRCRPGRFGTAHGHVAQVFGRSRDATVRIT